MKRLGLLCACAALFGAACGEESTPATTPPETPPETPPVVEPTPPENPDVPAPSPAGQVMRGHFSRAADARDALIRGDLPPAREDMAWLATHQGRDALPENLRPLFDQMQSEASHFGEATTLTEAGTALARTLNRCGECHRTANTGPQIATPAVPEGTGVAEQMQRHRWALSRMWEGLITNNAETYNAGAAVLRESRLVAGDLQNAAGSNAPADRVQPIADYVHQLGDRAAAAPDAAERANVYGRLLATCATCHRLLGVGDAVAEGEGVAPHGMPLPAAPAPAAPAPTAPAPAPSGN